jgi:hypothetical protein
VRALKAAIATNVLNFINLPLQKAGRFDHPLIDHSLTAITMTPDF